jgi:hypothetical protein
VPRYDLVIEGESYRKRLEPTIGEWVHLLLVALQRGNRIKYVEPTR